MTHPVTLLTGGSRGIGRAIGARLIADGHEVINVSRSRPDTAMFVASYQADLHDEAETAVVLREVVARHDVDNLVNNAAAIDVSPIEELSFDALRRLVEVNLRAVLQCIQIVAPLMKRKRAGRIVSLGSRAALGKPGRTIYSMTKGGIVGLSRSLALELARDGVTVNVVSPGPIETEMFRANSKPDDPAVQALTDSIPVGRMGRPDDVAAAVAFFLREDTPFITGQNLYVCGGLSINATAFI